MDLQKLLRKNIISLKPYSSARDEYSGEAQIYLDANEIPFNEPYNRYPDPLQRKLKEKIAELKNVPENTIFLGNGSDEPIDLLIRAFCEPGIDNIVTIDPTYGMYQVSADINNVEVRKITLMDDFGLNPEEILKSTDLNTKLIFLCSPNNPTGNSFEKKKLIKVISEFNGLVILDEAYIDFVPDKSFLKDLNKYKNLIILQTLSKAWGLAGIRLGMAFADNKIINVLNKIKYPYNLNILTQEKALDLINNEEIKNNWVSVLINERENLASELRKLPFVINVYPSDTNFLLINMHDANGIYNYLTDNKIITRNRSNVHLCKNCLRITISTKEENNILLDTLKELI